MDVEPAGGKFERGNSKKKSETTKGHKNRENSRNAARKQITSTQSSISLIKPADDAKRAFGIRSSKTLSKQNSVGKKKINPFYVCDMSPIINKNEKNPL